MKAKRPLSVTILAAGVLSVAVVFGTQAYQTLRQWRFLQSLPLSVSPVYLLGAGIVWAAAGLYIAVSLWRGLGIAPKATQIAAWAFAGYYWLDRLALASSPLTQTNQPFALGATITAIILIYWTLTRPKARAFFGEMHERKSEN